jgi:hypothetical protein
MWAAGDAGLKMISENGGNSWYTQEKNDSENMSSISFSDYKYGVAVGDAGTLYRTSTGGYPSFTPPAHGYQWMAAGSLHNWYSARGCEIEAERTVSSAQQDGWQWPAIGSFQDMQAFKGMWIGTKDFTDTYGNYYTHKVVHVGPRVPGLGEVFPIELKNYTKYNRPEVTVNGAPSFNKPIWSDSVDQNLIADQIMTNTINTEIGLTLTRRMMQFSLPGHDNYIIQEIELHNTGNTDSDPGIEVSNQTLSDVYLFILYRWAICFQTRYVIGNGTGWGMNAMLNARGDGDANISLYNDPEDERFRAQYTWHGYFPYKIVSYDNIGGPIWSRDASGASTYVPEADTVGRLGAAQFTGVATLHADLSSTDTNDDSNQPATTGYYGSDEPLTSNNSSTNLEKMISEFGWMTRGHMSPRHAWKVEPTGDFTIQTGAPNFPPRCSGWIFRRKWLRSLHHRTG